MRSGIIPDHCRAMAFFTASPMPIRGGLAVDQVLVEEFFIQGGSICTNNAREATDSGKIPDLWAKFYAAHPDPKETAYGVYSGYESDASGEFTVTAGIKVASMADATVAIQAGTYLMFPANGVMPAAIIDAWNDVWAYFSRSQLHVRAYETDFEQYIGPESAIIHIGIRESSQLSVHAPD
ncbi:MAG: GyrI-like domain-containing protein [Proteobacteria bacterium]|nr:GyrI-like domain-containing protein [Pseudomonadota bacterium]